MNLTPFTKEVLRYRREQRDMAAHAIVYIRRNSDRVVRDVLEPDWETADFCWIEGNYSCDCNRYLFFERAEGGDPEIDDGKYRCGDIGYSITVTDSGGVVLYKDQDW